VPSQPSRDRPPYEPGAVFAGKYAIRRVLGEGGMAVVYAAVDTSCDRQVAIKVLRPSAAGQRHISSAQVQREAATVVKLHERTPHVVEVLTAGVSEDQNRLPYYVMERLHGTTLREGIESKRRARQPFEYIEVASTVTEIAVALAYAHDLGIVHRDVKPENVYIAEQRDRSYMIKLLDFGVAALLANEEEPGRRRGFSGSRQYAAPEQLDGKAPAPACDVYAIGLILYEMLTFTLPHDRMNRALSIAETALNVLREPIPDLRSLRPDMPPRLAILVRTCLAYQPDQRPRALQVANMLRDIKRVLEGGLLGGSDTKATDVSGPPSGLLAEKLGGATVDVTAVPAQRMGGPLPVDPNASTDPGAAGARPGGVPADHEVFFMNRVADTTERLPALTDATAAPPTLVSQTPVTLPLNAPRFDPALLAQQTQPMPTEGKQQQPPAQPAWVSSQHSVEPFASRTQPEPTAPGRREPRRGRVVFATASLVVCVGVLGIAAGKTFLHRGATQPAAASLATPSGATQLPPAVSLASPEISAASTASSAPSELPSASTTAPAASSSSPAPPKSPPVAPVRPRPGSSNASPVGERPSSGL
jgi:serine/threonine-protein kinase